MIEFRWFNWQPTKKDFSEEAWRELCGSQLDPEPMALRRRDLQYRIPGGQWQTVPDVFEDR